MKLIFTSDSLELQKVLNKRLNKKYPNKFFDNHAVKENDKIIYFDNHLKFNKAKINPLLNT